MIRLTDLLKEFEIAGNQRINYFRAVGKDEMQKAIKLDHLPYLSGDPMSEDWEVIELSMQENGYEGDPQEYVDTLVQWNPKTGVNLTTDFDNAIGYNDYVLGLDNLGPQADFTRSHVFAKDPKKVKVVAVYDVREKTWTPIIPGN
jgi:hypothetical protein